jgi:hypothetical protein
MGPQAIIGRRNWHQHPLGRPGGSSTAPRTSCSGDTIDLASVGFDITGSITLTSGNDRAVEQRDERAALYSITSSADRPSSLPFPRPDTAVQGRGPLRATFTERSFDESDDLLVGVVYERLVKREIEKQLPHVPQHVRHEGLAWR